MKRERGNETASISGLPEGCVSEILSRTSPPDASRAAAISKGFKSAAESDAVWESFLPPDYREIIARAVNHPVFNTKMQLYFYLSDTHILLDRGYLSVGLDKWSGKKCYMLGARELSITWGDDPRYWEWGAIPESRFLEVGMLKDVCWLEIRGKIESAMLSYKTIYAAYLIFRIGENSYGLDVPGRTMVKYGGTETETSNVYLKKRGGRYMHRLNENYRLPHKRKDGWMEIKLGEFYCNEGDEGEVEMTFEEVKHRHWKSGLIVEGIELRPK